MADEINNPVLSDEISFGKKVCFGIGILPNTFMTNAILMLAMPIYGIALGVNEGLIGLALMITKFWDALTDPVMGNISDNCRSRWGRRRPFIALGSIAGAIFFILLWMPPIAVFGEFGRFLYFTFFSILLSTAYTAYIIPYNGLACELSYDYDERTRIMAIRAFIGAWGGLLVAWCYRLCFVGTDESVQKVLKKFTGSFIGTEIIKLFGQNEIHGVKIVAVLIGVIIIVGGLIPALSLREKTQYKTQETIGFIEAFKYTLLNKPFLMACGIVFVVTTGLFLTTLLQQYMFTYYVYDGDKQAGAALQGWAQTVYMIMTMVSVPVISVMGVRFGKRRVLMWALSLAAVGNLFRWFLVTPSFPILSVVNQILLAPGIACVWVMDSAMIADITDLDELNTGLRREGMYGAVQSFLYKIAMASAFGISGLLFEYINIDKNLAGPQSVETIFKMRFLFSFVPAVFMVLAFYITYKYPLTRDRCYQIRAELERRKQQN